MSRIRFRALGLALALSISAFGGVASAQSWQGWQEDYSNTYVQTSDQQAAPVAQPVPYRTDFVEPGAPAMTMQGQGFNEPARQDQGLPTTVLVDFNPAMGPRFMSGPEAVAFNQSRGMSYEQARGEVFRTARNNAHMCNRIEERRSAHSKATWGRRLFGLLGIGIATAVPGVNWTYPAIVAAGVGANEMNGIAWDGDSSMWLDDIEGWCDSMADQRQAMSDWRSWQSGP